MGPLTLKSDTLIYVFFVSIVDCVIYQLHYRYCVGQRRGSVLPPCLARVSPDLMHFVFRMYFVHGCCGSEVGGVCGGGQEVKPNMQLFK